jgi:hypothetical protein
MIEPRRLRLATLDNVVAEVERLHRDGYSQAGDWDLSQICEHLSDWMSYPMDGFPPIPFHMKMLLSAIRAVRGKKDMHAFIESQSLPKNQPTLPASVHAPDKNEAESVLRFKSMIDRLKEYRGTIHRSPLFGKLDRNELIALQTAHSVHHLNFLIPKADS